MWMNVHECASMCMNVPQYASIWMDMHECASTYINMHQYALTVSVPNDVHVRRAFLVERQGDVHVREKMHHQRPRGFPIVPSQRPHGNLRYSHTDQTTYMYAIRYARQRPNDVPPLPALPDLYMFFYVLDIFGLWLKNKYFVLVVGWRFEYITWFSITIPLQQPNDVHVRQRSFTIFLMRPCSMLSLRIRNVVAWNVSCSSTWN